LEIEEFKIPETEIANNAVWLVKILVLAGLAKSNGDARRLIEGGGISLDGEKISDVTYEIIFPLKGEGVIKAGKRRFVKIIN